MLRETLIWSLGRAMTWAKVLDALVPPFNDWRARTKSDDVVELGAGTGETAAAFLRALAERGAEAPRFVLTDLQPRLTAWAELQREHPTIEVLTEPVDVFALPSSLLAGRACTLINTLHHFAPVDAQRALLSVCAQARGVFVAEGMVRNPLRFLAMAPAGWLASMVAPLVLPANRLQRAAASWLSPAMFAAGAWDGCVSAMRMHSERELRGFVAPLGDSWTWQWGTFSYGQLGRGSYFAGVPTQKAGVRLPVGSSLARHAAGLRGSG